MTMVSIYGGARSAENRWIAYFIGIRWPKGYCCRNCGHNRAYVFHTRRLPLFQCRSCRHQTSLTAGTVMEGSRTPLAKWAAAMQFLTRESSINAVQLTKEIQVTYKTAWAMLKKIRHAIAQIDYRELLSGRVRAGLSFYGRDYLHQPFVAHPQEHPVMVGAAFNTNGEPTYVKMKLVSKEHMNGKHMYRSGEKAFVENHVAEGNYDTMILKRFRIHEESLLSQLIKEARTWLNRTFHGIGAKYLQYYMDEFCYRINLSFRTAVSALDSLSAACLSVPSPSLI